MKTAVCWSGQPRTVRATWRSTYTNFLKGLGDFDLFIHTSQEYQVDDDFWEVLKPKAYKVESQFPFPEQERTLARVYFCNTHIKNYLQQIYGYKRVWELKRAYQKEQGVVYGETVRCRPDLEFVTPVTPNIFTPGVINLLRKGAGPDGVPYFTDVFAIGPDEDMAVFFGLFDWLFSEGGCDSLNPGDPWTMRLPPLNAAHCDGKYSPETLLSAYLMQFKGLVVESARRFLDEVVVLRR